MSELPPIPGLKPPTATEDGLRADVVPASGQRRDLDSSPSDGESPSTASVVLWLGLLPIGLLAAAVFLLRKFGGAGIDVTAT